jgi:ABC-type lipoprotein release transport system permease subunit
VTLTYVLRNLLRRKVRTVLMVLSLIVGVAALVALYAMVESYRRYYAGTVGGEVGAYDLVITRPDTAPHPFLDAAELAARILAIDGVRAVAPRIHAVVSLSAVGQDGDTTFVAMDPEHDGFGSLEIVEGSAELGEDAAGIPGAVVLQETADVFGLHVGDPIEIRYAPPQTRLKGSPAEEEGGSRRRTTAGWVVRGIATQRGITGNSTNEGVIVGLEQARRRFGLGQAAERLLVDVDRTLYQSSDPQRSSFRIRDIVYQVRQTLGETDYAYTMPRTRAVMDGANQFIFFQSLVTMYGLLSLGVVGLLIRTLIMTNVQEQTRDMAILRILGAPRRRLFNLVAAEVAVIGVLGVGLGVVIGQAINTFVLAPWLARQAGDLGAASPLVSTRSVLVAVLVAGVVLAWSTLAPARKAAGTKVTHAINPGVAEGIGLDDLAALRERRTDLRLTAGGLVVLLYPLLIFFAFPLAFDFGILWVLATLFTLAFLALIIGAALVFYIVILPMERGLMAIIDGLAPRAGYFVRRTVLRGKARNTLISLMIVVSATLPTFLSTSLALETANADTDRQMQGGAPFRISPPAPLDRQRRYLAERAAEAVFNPELLAEVRSDPAFSHAVAVSKPHSTRVRDGVGLRDVDVVAMGVDADLAPALYPEAIDLLTGDVSAFQRIVSEPNAAIIGAGLATYLDRGVGDTILLAGEGQDHDEVFHIVGVAQRVGGVGTFSAKQTRVWSGESTVLTGMDTFRRLIHDPGDGPPDPRERVVRLLLATPAAGVDEAKLTSDLRLRYATEHDLVINSTAETLKTVREESRTAQLFMIILAAITSVLAVFGVFAVIYVSIYGRRAEIGLLKAIGSPGRHLLTVFVGEAMVMTLSATLTGVTAGVLLAYALRMSESFQEEVPTKLAFDPVIVPAILVLMILSSLVSAVLATYGYRRRSAIEILRTV